MPKIKFFLTHSWHDIEFARKLFGDLTAQGLEGFFDDKSLKGGNRLAEEINRGMEWCDVYIPVLSRVALDSPWCWEEINAAINLSNQRARQGRPQIIPVLIEDCNVPALLASRLYFNFTNRYEQALNELLTRGFGLSLSSAVPDNAIPQKPTILPERSATPKSVAPAARPQTRSNSLIPVGIVSGVLIVCVVMAIVAAIAVSQFVNTSDVSNTTTPIAQSSPTLVANVVTSIPLAAFTPIRILTLTPNPTDTPRPTVTYTPKPTDTSRPTAVPTLGIGSSKLSPIDGATMIYVPAGDFLMGSNDRDDDEKPAHTVYLDPFWIDKSEVTNALYIKCVSAGKCQPPTPTTSYTRDAYYGNSQYDNYPVIYVSWDSANAFCSWANKKLPTEAQWEKATRGTDGRTYPWGNAFDGAKVNSWDSNPRPGDTTAGGSYSAGASPYGAMDMAGNVWEWVADWYGSYPSGTQRNPMGPSTGQSHVLRGGSWFNNAFVVRAAIRLGRNPDLVFWDVGFRCVE